MPLHLFMLLMLLATQIAAAAPVQHTVRQVAQQRIAFASNRDHPGTYQTEIYTMNVDGSDVQRLTTQGGTAPDWSPDGKRITYMVTQSSATTYYSDIYVMNTDGSAQRRLTTTQDASSPDWSPDGTTIAFSRTRSDEYLSDIYIMNADGSSIQRLTTRGGNHPDWSPDGQYIIFDSVRDCDPTFPVCSGFLYKINVASLEETPLGNGFAYAPHWSPDGKLILFSFFGDSIGSSGILLMNADGSNIHSIPTDALFDVGAPAWSADGSKIVFSGEIYGKYSSDIYKMNPDGTGLTQLTTNEASDFAPAWSPKPLDPNGDEDGDGLLNGWEQHGIDADQNGSIDLALYRAPFNADPFKKDIFLELDYMSCSLGGCLPLQNDNMRPLDTAIADVEAAFASKNIRLHIFLSEPVPMVHQVIFSLNNVPRGSSAADDFDDLKDGSNAQGNTGVSCGIRDIDGHLGTMVERSDPNCATILKARRMAVRYGIFGYQIKDHEGSSGVAWGDDLLVTLGGWSLFGQSERPINKWGGQRVAQASTLMHELGHTLGLDHGGGDAINCKPNYLSIMNYTLQFPVYDPNRPMEYSDTALSPLNENALIEKDGIGGPANRIVLFGAGFEGKGLGKPANGPVDWNGNGVIDTNPTQADSNYITVQGCNDAKSPGDTLTGFNDWVSLHLKSIANNLANTQHIGIAQSGLVYDISEAAAIELAQLVDADNDGFSNYDDNCPGSYNPDQKDNDQDDIGDICSHQMIFLPRVQR